MNKFGKRIKELRQERNISRKQLAEAMYVSIRTISHWETGTRECDFETLIKLADFFNETTDYLLGKTDF